jgi:hypothetical protein
MEGHSGESADNRRQASSLAQLPRLRQQQQEALTGSVGGVEVQLLQIMDKWQ